MSTRSATLRHRAFLLQSGRCFYCGWPMWENAPEAFAKAHQLSPAQASCLQCTAEHLLAREDGGRNAKRNIVAACLACNQNRHRGRQALDADAYKRHIEQSRGKYVGRIGRLRNRWKNLLASISWTARI